MGSNKVSDEKWRKMLDAPSPVSVPQQAYGPRPLEYRARDREPVWAWVNWSNGSHTPESCFVVAANDRVVRVAFYGPRGEHQVVVWRSAVRHRKVTPEPTPAQTGP